MKRIILSALVAVFSLCANAQYEAEEGDIAVEVGFNPFSNSFNTIKLNGGSINARYFFNDKNAARVNLGFGYDRKSDKYMGHEVSKHAGSFSIDLGIENHFASFDRIDLYAGGQLGFATTFGGGKLGDAEISGAVPSDWSASTVDPCSTRFSLKGFTGANFFIYKKLYVGAEFGLSFSNRTYKDYEVKSGSYKQKAENNESNTSIAFYSEPALHLGWVF
ncbi:MAG: outer membrane beta-barrel protein [Bacteroidaceae bacterium]|nr:outer membrane beta-barrel protein [Bacteroidaceae bacterium]